MVHEQQPLSGEIEALLELYGARRFAEAESRTRVLLGKYPGFAFGWKLLGGILQAQGKGKDALPAFRRVAELAPNEADSHFNIGVILKGMGRFEEAVASYRRAISLKPDYAEAYSNLGNVQHELGQYADSIDSYRRAIRLQPGSAIAYNNLGTALKDTGDQQGAMENYRKAIQLEPVYAEAYGNLGNVLKDLGRFVEAEQYLLKAMAIRPDYAESYSNLGNLLKDMGRVDTALANYRKALEIDPSSIKALLGISQLHLINGETARAEEMIGQVLQLHPGNLEARFMLTQSRKTMPGDDNLAALVEIGKATQDKQLTLSYPQNIALNFTLGKCFDDLGEYERAFPYFLEGNRLMRSTLAYHAATITRDVDELMRIFTRESVARLRGTGNDSNMPIFVLGMPRSGTTLVEQIIASHPDVHGAGELLYMQAIVRGTVAGVAGFPGNLRHIDQATLAKWGSDYVARLRKHAPEAQHITDKLPNNFWYVGLIHLMLPDAKIIHVRRNPVDTCLSCYTKLFNSALNHTYNLAELGRYYVDYVRLMEHWRSVLPPGTFLDVQYEDIVASQEVQARKLIDYCGLTWNDVCLDFHKTKRAVGTASLSQVRKPIYQSSVERWRSYEKFLGPLLDALGDLGPERS